MVRRFVGRDEIGYGRETGEECGRGETEINTNKTTKSAIDNLVNHSRCFCVCRDIVGKRLGTAYEVAVEQKDQIMGIR